MKPRRKRGCIGTAILAVAVCVGCGLSHIGTSTIPFQIGALIDGGHLTAGQAGLFGFFEVGALAISMILIAPWIGRLSAFSVAVAGCGLALCGTIGMLGSPGFLLQLALAMTAGTGFGFVFAATIAAAAAYKEPDRLYGIGNSGALLIIVGIMSALPLVQHRTGPLSVFALLACLALLCMPFFLGFPGGGAARNLEIAAFRMPGAPGLLFCWAAVSLGTTALYAFSERIGQSLHLPETSIASVLSIGVVVGLVGTGIAIVLGKRLNRKWALFAGICGTAASCLLLGYATSLPLFAIGVFAYWIFYMFLYCYLLGTAASLDPYGRLGTLGGGMERLGFAAGAWLGGIMAEHFSYASTGLLGCICCLTGLLFGLPTVFRALDGNSSSNAGIFQPETRP